MFAVSSKIAPFALAVTGVLGLSAAMPTAQAAPPVARFVVDHEHVSVHYSLPNSASKHFHNHTAAHQFAASMRRLGCHAKIDHDGRHYDVVYHLHRDRSASFDCVEEAHQFARRLERLGFRAHVHH
jgi:hypothetical protein